MTLPITPSPSAQEQREPNTSSVSGPTPHPRRFDRETYNQLDGIDLRLLEAIDYDSRICAKTRRSGARYSLKSEAYYAVVIGVRRETISFHVCKLERLGVLSVTRRNPIRGKWQTNLYKLVSFVWWRMRKVIKILRGKKKTVCAKTHTNQPYEGEENRKEVLRIGRDPETRQILERWLARGEAPTSQPD